MLLSLQGHKEIKFQKNLLLLYASELSGKIKYI